MIKIFLKPSKINQIDWAKVYRKTVEIAISFPLRLVRLESYNGYQPELDKLHFDLIVEKNTPNEHLSFYGDWMSWTGDITIRFYKNWDKQLELASNGQEYDGTKPLTWHPHQPFKDDGSLPDGNGVALGENGYLEQYGSLSSYAVLAVGTMLENVLPGRAFMVDTEPDRTDILKVVEWLEGHFKEPFEPPIYFDKKKVLASFADHYEDKKQVACRMEHLYRKRYKQNMEFAIGQIGYQPAFNFYAEVLTLHSFGTFGFSDVIDPWLAVTKDLESMLELIAESKRLLAKDPDKNQWKLEKYDLTHTLKNLLAEFILWTPQQRESLSHFYTNEQALETGREDLFGSMMRMVGQRVDICPVHATETDLFEAFMYHDPKNGYVFKKIIDGWVEKNTDAFKQFKLKLEEVLEEKNANLPPGHSEDEEKMAEMAERHKAFVNEYPEHERFFVNKALMTNPSFILEEVTRAMIDTVEQIISDEENRDYIKRVQAEPKEEKVRRIRHRIKELRMSGLSVHPDFESWLEEEDDGSVLLRLRMLMALKLYERHRAYARFRILWDRSLWDVWRGKV